MQADLPLLTDDDLVDFEDAPDGEQEAQEDQLLDRATAATTIAELEAEIASLTDLEAAAARVLRSGADHKWAELSALLQNTPEMFDPHGQRRKLVIFTEHRDMLNYFTAKIRSLLGRVDAVVTIHGGVQRDERRRAQEEFAQNPHVHVLIATDAAGEGINLQRAHLMVNYDLPWNPNRLEQRFGRIHRIGQTEVCHLWNLVPRETREGDVYSRLLRKLEAERASLGGQVFDVLGKVSFGTRPLRELLVEAIRYGERPDVRARLWDVLRQYVVEHLGADDAIVVIDKTGFLKRGRMSAGVARQYRGTAGRIENAQVGVFLSYVSRHGHTLLDRELYLPKEWTEDRERYRQAGMPPSRPFATKPTLARQS